VVALDDIIADVKSDYPEADLKSTTVDGKIYAVKMVDDMGVLYYRKSILKKEQQQCTQECTQPSRSDGHGKTVQLLAGK
jgi:ABC-type glycerol-3-phosphate transport system substrate-binding protein